jgi:hypothetical protein
LSDGDISPIRLNPQIPHFRYYWKESASRCRLPSQVPAPNVQAAEDRESPYAGPCIARPAKVIAHFKSNGRIDVLDNCPRPGRQDVTLFAP